MLEKAGVGKMTKYAALQKIIAILVIILAACLGAFGCTPALMTFGVLDAPEQKKMFESFTRAEFEEIAGKPVSSRTTPSGRKVCLYKYVDGEVGVIGRRNGTFSEERELYLFSTIAFCGLFEPIMVPVTMWERSESTRQIYVIYDSSEHIQAVCRVSKQADPLCASELTPEEESILE
jgi:hypothetical protein